MSRLTEDQKNHYVEIRARILGQLAVGADSVNVSRKDAEQIAMSINTILVADGWGCFDKMADELK